MLKTLIQASRPVNDQEVQSLFRDLYTRILINIGLDGTSVLGVSSAITGEGKSTIAKNIATMLADDGVLALPGNQLGNILFVECNQGSGALSREFDLPAAPGLVQYLQHQCALDAVIKQTSLPRLSVLPVGEAPHNFPILIRAPAMHEMVQLLRKRFDMIILDLPSLLLTTDTQVLADLTDHLLLVVRSGVTSSKLVYQALEEVEREAPGHRSQR